MSRTVRVLIVDDEVLSRQRIQGLLAGERDVEVVGEASNGIEAVDLIESTTPDLVFLDVQMPELNGLDVVQSIDPEHGPQIVFVTAYDSYMERAFEVHALDYLRKPFTDRRFLEMLAHARRRIEEQRGFEDARRGALSILSELREQPRWTSDRLIIREVERAVYQVIQLPEIDWLEAHEKHVRVHAGKKVYLWRGTLAEAERRLDPEMFLRLHRSIIVNSAHVRTVEPLWKGEYVVTLDNGKKVTTGRTYRAAVEAFLRRT